MEERKDHMNEIWGVFGAFNEKLKKDVQTDQDFR